MQGFRAFWPGYHSLSRVLGSSRIGEGIQRGSVCERASIVSEVDPGQKRKMSLKPAPHLENIGTGSTVDTVVK